MLPNYCLSRTIPNNVRTLFGTQHIKIRGTANSATPLIQHVSMYHRCSNITVPQQFLHRSDIIASFNQVRRERASERMGRHPPRAGSQMEILSSGGD